jgi:putative flippase GtrA
VRQVVTRANVAQVVGFGLNGASTAVVYSIAIWTLIAVSPRTFAVDVVAAYAIAVAVNYLGARLIFKPGDDLRTHFARYAILVAANSIATAVLASWLHRLGVHYALAVYFPVAVTVIPTFVLMRTWVFKRSTIE